MRIFALSDVHVDHKANAEWIASMSIEDYREDVLILAGDVGHTLSLLYWCLSTLAARFKKVLFVPGNHDLWVLEDDCKKTSVQKFEDVLAVAQSAGAWVRPFNYRDVSIVPLFGWYDYSFGQPSEELRLIWMDYHACRWPAGFGPIEISTYFSDLNAKQLNGAERPMAGKKTITFSHFVPRIDVMPSSIFDSMRWLYPVLGSCLLERQLRSANASLHVYGHSHLNRNVVIDGVSYINNALGYPYEKRITSRQLLCIHAG